MKNLYFYNWFKPVISILKSAIINPIVLLAKSPFYLQLFIKVLRLIVIGGFLTPHVILLNKDRVRLFFMLKQF